MSPSDEYPIRFQRGGGLLATLENPLHELVPTFLCLPASARPAARDLVAYLKDAPHSTTLMRFGCSMKSPGDRIWLPGQYARHSIAEGDLARIFFADEQQAVQKLRGLVEEWFNVRQYRASLWESVPQISRLPPFSLIHRDERQTFGVFVLAPRRDDAAVELRVVGAEDGSTRAASVKMTLTSAQAQQLADILYAGGSIELTQGIGSLYCRSSAALTSIRMRHIRRPGRTHTIPLTEFQRYAFRNRILAVLHKGH